MTPDIQESAKVSWCEDFFDDLFAEHCLATRTADELAGIVAFLKDKFALRTGDMIFDQCCGIGTLSLELAKRGYRTYGVDLIPSYIATARMASLQTQSACHFDAGDACAYIPPYPCDAAINWWTSFGYFESDSENLKMLVAARRNLKAGGKFALDYMNTPERLAQFKGKDSTFWRVEKPGCVVACETRVAGRMLVKDWRYEGADAKRVVKKGGGVKLYTQDDLTRLFKQAGFTNIRFYGSIKGEALKDASPRCIVTAQNPEDVA
jgi:ubiquinone/menaquinone biosynthesis C-methylase UbiE